MPGARDREAAARRLKPRVEVVDRIEAGPRDLIVFVDETGHEEFADPENPTFGFGGCATLDEAYRRDLAEPWIDLKREHFGGPTTRMHASKMGRLDPVRAEALGRFFRDRPFFRFAAVCRASLNKSEKYANAYDALACALFRCIGLEAQRCDPQRVVLVIEASQRGDSLALAHLGGFHMRRRTPEDSTEIPIQPYLLDKSAREPGLEVADFVAHTAGTQARRAIGGPWPQRRDFASVFPEDSPKRHEFMLVHEAGLPPIARRPPGEPERIYISLESYPVDE